VQPLLHPLGDCIQKQRIKAKPLRGGLRPALTRKMAALRVTRFVKSLRNLGQIRCCFFDHSRY
jgi:hypothetical protein